MLVSETNKQKQAKLKPDTTKEKKRAMMLLQ